jgi:dTDP-glucose 4,6-dehydratase
VLERGRIGECYNIGSRCERTNLEVVERLCTILDRLHPRPAGGRYRDLITLVADRPGHDQRYAMDPTKIERDLGWSCRTAFERGLEETVRWYLDNRPWWVAIRERRYGGERLGLTAKSGERSGRA